MQLNKNQVIEIKLKDLFFHILYRWRSIFIAALIGALLLCGYQYLSIRMTHDAGKLTKEERQYQLDLQDYKEDLESSQNTISANTRLLQSQNAYRTESIYFQLNPQGVWTATNKYLVKADQSVIEKLPQGSTIDPADSILSAYTAPLSEATDEELSKAFGTDKPEYVGELVTIKNNSGDNTVTVSIIGATKDAVQAGMAFVHSKMEAIAASRAQEIDKHTFSLVSSEVKLGVNNDLAKEQNEFTETSTDIQKLLQKARNRLNELEIQKEPKEPSAHLLRMAIIGFIVGAVLLALMYTIDYILKGRLYNSRDLAERYHLPVLGELMIPGYLHSGKGLDKLISKWELGKRKLDDDTVYDNVAAIIAEKQGIRSILLVSTLPAEKLSSVKKSLSERLPDKAINAQGDLLHNSEAITEASNTDAIVITEKKGNTRYEDMDRMVENLIITEAKVIGAIIL